MPRIKDEDGIDLEIQTPEEMKKIGEKWSRVAAIITQARLKREKGLTKFFD